MWSIIFTSLTFFHFQQGCETVGWNDYLSVDLTGSLNILLSAPHGGNIKTLTPAAPNRRHGCYINGQCVYRHNCSAPDESQ